MLNRSAISSLIRRLKNNPVVVVYGPRQCGKTMLVKELLSQNETTVRTYYTLDDVATLDFAKRDPQGFIASLSGNVVIDEIQRAPGLMLAIKLVVDKNRTQGRFVLTGSANPLALPKLGDSLAGRMGMQPLWPLSRQELTSQTVKDFWSELFDPAWQPTSFVVKKPKEWPMKWTSWVAQGGYPDALSLDEFSRREWLRDMLNLILQRDIKELANIADLIDLPLLLRAAASRAGKQLSFASIARDVKIPSTTFKRYWAVLDAVFLLGTLPAWSPNLAKRVVKSPKVLMRDTGLACALLGLNDDRLKNDTMLGGGLLENFVVMEAIKNQGHSMEPTSLYHLRTDNGDEVDLIAETPDGRVVGIEVKAGATVRVDDTKGLQLLRNSCGKKFVRGIVFYSGTQVIPLGEKIFAVPLAWWEGD